MGCVASKLDINDVHPDMFTVLNIDQDGSKVSPGQIEVTPAELVLYQKGKDPVRWPFKSLRRYGCEGDMFSFESGRRCPTGPGIYAFKCRRAENLFNLLQSKIRAGDNLAEPSISGGSPTGDDPTTPRILATPSFGFPGPSTLPRPSISESVATETIAEAAPMYVNCDVVETRGSQPPATLPPLTSLPPLLPSSDQYGQGPVMNGRSILPPMGAPRVPPLHPDIPDPDTPTHQYENVIAGGPSSPGYRYPRTSFSLPPKPVGLLDRTSVMLDNKSNLLDRSPTSPATSPPISPHSTGPMSPMFLDPDSTLPLNYILLDLEAQVDAIQPSNGNNRPGVGYTTIDFNKTAALIKSANQRYEDDEPGVRKTRHNSSISDISSAFKTPLSPTD